VKKIFGIGFVAVLVLAACGKSNNNGASSGGSPSQGTAGGGVAVLTVNTGTAQGAGTVLVDAQGLTLYYLKGETASNIQCSGSCLSTWPPLLFSGSGQPTGGVHVTGTLGTVQRPDGKGTQVTYNGLPLYTFTGDSSPGQAAGQGVNNFYAATPSSSASGSGGGRYGGGSASPSASGYGY
jgi:predicted lipoprotein with Yx(FWY)xxD motif